MKKYGELTYADKIHLRIRISVFVLIMMLIYMVAVGINGGGDSRVVTPLADMVGDLIFFGGFVYLVIRIMHNRKLLENRIKLREQQCLEQDERNQYLHDKSGGIVMDILLIVLLFTTVTAALYNMPAFYVSFAILLTAVILKTAAYQFYSRR